MTRDCQVLYSPEQLLQSMNTRHRFWQVSRAVFRNMHLATSYLTSVLCSSSIMSTLSIPHIQINFVLDQHMEY